MLDAIVWAAANVHCMCSVYVNLPDAAPSCSFKLPHALLRLVYLFTGATLQKIWREMAMLCWRQCCYTLSICFQYINEQACMHAADFNRPGLYLASPPASMCIGAMLPPTQSKCLVQLLGWVWARLHADVQQNKAPCLQGSFVCIVLD